MSVYECDLYYLTILTFHMSHLLRQITPWKPWNTLLPLLLQLMNMFASIYSPRGTLEVGAKIVYAVYNARSAPCAKLYFQYINFLIFFEVTFLHVLE